MRYRPRRIKHSSFQSRVPSRLLFLSQVFLKYSKEYPPIVERIQSLLQPGPLRLDTPAHGRKSILDIGAGDGQLLRLLDEVSPLRQSVGHYSSYETDGDAASRLQKAVAELNLQDATVNCTAFSTGTAVERKYDLILWCHSLYGLDRKVPTLLHSLMSLAPGGCCAVVLRREKLEPLLQELRRCGVDATELNAGGRRPSLCRTP
ncbi:unnamed protein product [Symbiodinium natans]|uniref:Methyltransferase domain-containing protein n=1 Tax=Symbiodinium natans TaxID=878477 RepID=A0A812I1A6_9DINO|nr:unnamed protein product [Symbiodinium natans]